MLAEVKKLQASTRRAAFRNPCRPCLEHRSSLLHTEARIRTSCAIPTNWNTCSAGTPAGVWRHVLFIGRGGGVLRDHINAMRCKCPVVEFKELATGKVTRFQGIREKKSYTFSRHSKLDGDTRETCSAALSLRRRAVAAYRVAESRALARERDAGAEDEPHADRLVQRERDRDDVCGVHPAACP